MKPVFQRASAVAALTTLLLGGCSSSSDVPAEKDVDWSQLDHLLTGSGQPASTPDLQHSLYLEFAPLCDEGDDVISQTAAASENFGQALIGGTTLAALCPNKLEPWAKVYPTLKH